MYPVPGPYKQWLGRLQQLPLSYEISAYVPFVRQIREAERALQDDTDSALKARAMAMREQVLLAPEGAQRECLDGLMVEAFALVSEIASRTVEMRPFDVQLIAAIALYRGHVVEMQTGEGKTLAAVMPAFLYALTGKGVHILTFNDYLARRDAAWMGPIFEALGLSVGAQQKAHKGEARRAAWACDITYATAKEMGFDVLRDQLARSASERVHRPFHYAIVDEADSILIDEARVPLVIAGETSLHQVEPHTIATLVGQLAAGEHYSTDEFKRVVYLTESGQEWLEEQLQEGDLHSADNRDLLASVQVALYAQVLLQKDVDYIVREGKVELVDEFTGRVVEDRQWPDGIQGALEAKEGLELQPAGEILGSITLQHLMRLYPTLAGMTGTARPSEQEFFDFYGRKVLVLPTHRPGQRVDHRDWVFVDRTAKHRAIVEELRRCQEQGRPVLVGTSSVEESELLSNALTEAQIEHKVLNARTDEAEAGIIAQAGTPGAVTISTNMAGRGVDIKLGGADEATRDEVLTQGGLYVIGTTRHESVRVDYQLRGRAGRQGDPGSSRFFVSLEDPLMVRFGISNLVPTHVRKEVAHTHAPIDNPVLHRAIESTQRVIEGQNLTIRHTLFKYSSFIEEQRQLLQELREEALEGSPFALAALDPALFQVWQKKLDPASLAQLERDVALAHIDRFWSQHLARLNDIREGVHLQSARGIDPFIVFCQEAAAVFDDREEVLAAAIHETFRVTQEQGDDLTLEGLGLQRPSSTWTYLINDEVFGQGLAAFFQGAGSAFAAGGFFLFLPLIFLWGIWKKLFPTRRS